MLAIAWSISATGIPFPYLRAIADNDLSACFFASGLKHQLRFVVSEPVL